MVTSKLWCIVFYLLPESYRALDQVHTINGKLDPKWSEYLSEIAGDYVEEPPRDTTTSPFTEKAGWSLTRYGESAFVAVIHRNTTSSTSKVSLDPGDACGGALVSSDKVITLCLCLASWYNWVKNGATGLVTPGTVQSKYDIIAEQIHVTYSDLDFAPNFATKLKNKFEGPPSGSCPTNADHRAAQMVDILIAQFAPAIKHSAGGQFMPWPPYPIAQDGSHPVELAATVMGYNMMARNNKKFWNEFGLEILVNISTVKFRTKNTKYTICANNPDLWKTLPNDLSTKVLCYLTSNETFELCGGLVGNPVLLANSIHGLVLSTISCEKPNNDFAVLSFDKNIRENIESWVGEELGGKKTEYLGEENRREVVYKDFEPPVRIQESHSRGITSVSLDILPVLLLSLIVSSAPALVEK